MKGENVLKRRVVDQAQVMRKNNQMYFADQRFAVVHDQACPWLVDLFAHVSVCVTAFMTNVGALHGMFSRYQHSRRSQLWSLYCTSFCSKCHIGSPTGILKTKPVEI